MALVAAISAALAALGAFVATGGLRLGSVGVAPAAYALALLPGVVAVALGRRAPAVRAFALPPQALRWLRFGGIGVALLLVSAKQLPEVVAGAVTTGAALAAVALAYWWPRPAFLRASVGLAALALLRPQADPRENVAALVVAVMAAAVALVACNRLDTATYPVLGGTRPAVRPRRVVAEAAFVAGALLLGGLLSSRLEQRRPAPSSQSSTGANPVDQQPAPLAFQDVLDPNEAGPGRRGGDPDQVVLKVDADRAGVLRAITFDMWDGRRWGRSAALGESRVFDDRGGVPVRGDRFGIATASFVRQRITVEAPYAGVAVATPEVLYYDLPVAGQVFPDGAVALRPALGKGAVYIAQTAWRGPGGGELRSSPAGLPHDGVPSGSRIFDPGVLDTHALSADPGLSDRARALAERVTAGAAGDYDKVAALTAYLDAHVAVDDDVAPLPAGADAVDSVLFGGRPSSPERLATALALLTRAVGLPARLTTGFLPGRRPFFGGDFAVRAGDAHAWVEVPFLDLGWERFDPSGRIATAEAQDSLWARLQRAWERFWPLFVLVVAAVGVVAVRRLVARRRRLAATPWASRYFTRLVRVGAERGRPHRRAETPAEYTTALAGGVLADERLVEVGRVLTEAAWSGRQPAATTRVWAEQVLDEAARANPAYRRTRRPPARTGPGAAP